MLLPFRTCMPFAAGKKTIGKNKPIGDVLFSIIYIFVKTL